MTQYHEATGDPRVMPVMTRYFKHHLAESAKRPLRDWGRQRWADELLSVLWLYNRTGDEKLFELARVLGAQGRDWKAHFADFQFTSKVDADVFKQYQQGGLSDFALGLHGVNNAMAMKTSVVWSQVSKGELGGSSDNCVELWVGAQPAKARSSGDRKSHRQDALLRRRRAHRTQSQRTEVAGMEIGQWLRRTAPHESSEKH
ncbi:MAG: glycoside hydrolase family 127 protein [Acidobacteria bacterium]|nr:glycoside hydrolase family 127 protein [Acidobacteriota bacterium]